MRFSCFVLAAVSLLAVGCSQPASSSAPTATDAKAFLDSVNATTLKLGIDQSRAGWVQQTFITADTEILSAQASQAANDAGARFAKESTKYDKVDVPPDA